LTPLMICISVVIPTCDRPSEFLRAAVDSALSQSLAPLEVIVVDNGTHDADAAALPEGVVLHRLPPRVGPSRARNFGAAMAKGTYLAFLDDDDWWDANFLREAWSVLQAEGTHCVYGRLDHIQNGEVRSSKCLRPDTLNVASILRTNPGTSGQNLLIDKLLFWEVGGFDERLATSEDRALALEIILAKERISIAPSAVVFVRSHHGERARKFVHRRVRFVVKYRSVYGTTKAVSEIFRIMGIAFSIKFRALIRRVKRQHNVRFIIDIIKRRP